MTPLLIYGAYGYTGVLIAELARTRGFEPTLAGRDPSRVEPLARRLELPWRSFGLDDPGALLEGLAGINVVLHCAGPFSRTAAPMANACIERGAHYLDITGEIEVFEAMAGLSHRAREAGVMLMPGVGFDVVPTDCMAAHLKDRLPDATALELAISTTGQLSHGTATTVVENLGKPGLVRRGGVLLEVPTGTPTREVDFGRGATGVMAIPWGDVSTAYHTTGIPDITTYLDAPLPARMGARIGGLVPWMTGSGTVQRLLKRQIESRPAGPDPQRRARAEARVWGEARDDRGKRVQARIVTPDPYTLTADAALVIAARTLEGQAQAGFQTPAGRFGAGLVLELEGTERVDVE